MSDFRLLILDYGVGNIRSVENALLRLGYQCIVSSDPRDLEEVSLIVLPGVGAFSEGMKNLNESGLVSSLNEAVLVRRVPILGICLGMQLMARQSQENGLHKGLGWIDGDVVRLKSDAGVCVPHVGWTPMSICRPGPLFERINTEASFYFDHSYRLLANEDCVVANIEYGENICSAIQKENIFGVQFHPEKSQKNGLKLFRGLIEHLKSIEEEPL